MSDDETPTSTAPDQLGDLADQARDQLGELAGQAKEMAGQAREIVDAAGDDAAAAAASAARLVQRAGVILEEELSSGLDALDRLEQRYVDVDRMRDPETFVLLSRFRSDAHQIVDLLIDVVGASLDGVGKLADQGISIGVPIGKVTGPISGIVGGNGAADKGAGSGRTGGGRSVNGGATGHAAVLESAEPVAAGETARVSMAVTNRSGEETERFAVVASDLVSDGGARIASDRIGFEPMEVTLAPGASERVAIVVDVPADAVPGRYAGLVQATHLDHVRAVLVIAVT